MSLCLVGLNHKTAPLALREALVFADDDLASYLEHLLALDGVREAVILSTCHRTEMICDLDDTAVLLPWIAAQKGLDVACLIPYAYVLEQEAAISHMMRVATGLDSMILGEPQIFGQMKAAVAKAANMGALGSQLDRLFQRVFFVAKKIRNATAIGACPVSLASVITKLVMSQGAFETKTVAIVGAGDTASIIARRFKSAGTCNLRIINRTLAAAERLASEIEGSAHSLPDLQQVIASADVVVVAAACPTPLITRQMITAVSKSLLIVDVSMPRTVEPSVAEHSDIALYCIDDLHVFINDNKKGREHAAYQAETMIMTESQRFMRWLRSLEASQTINSYRQHVERISVLERDKALLSLSQGVPAEAVITALAHTLARKLMHKPSVNMRKAGYDGRMDMLECAQELLGIK